MSIYFQCIVKGCPPTFAQYGKVLEILGNDYFVVKTRSVEKLSTLVDEIQPLNKTLVHSNPHNQINLTTNNLAEVLPVKLDYYTTIQQEYEDYIKKYKVKINHNRLYPKLNELSSYFRNLLKNIIDVLGFPYLDITFQVHDARYLKETIDLECVHIDFYRYTNVTIPIYLDSKEHINFHKNSSTQDIISSSSYSLYHPSMVNVGMYHSVSLKPNTTRVLLQLSYLHTFDEIYNKNPQIFNIYN